MTSRSVALAPGSRPCRTCAAYSLRFEATNARIAGRGHERRDAVAEVVDPGRRRGYAIVAGRDLRPRRPEVLLERGFAQAWGAPPGRHLLRGRGSGRRGWSASWRPPTTSASRSPSPASTSPGRRSRQRFDTDHDPDTNLAEIWLRNPRYLDEVLVQARASSFGLRDIRFATRSGRARAARPGGGDRDRPAGRAFGDRARHRGRDARGVRASRGAAAAGHDRRTASGGSVARARRAVARSSRRCWSPRRPPRSGWRSERWPPTAPASRLLTLLNEPPPGTGLVLPLAGAWLLSVAIPVGGDRVARRGGPPGGSIVGQLRGGGRRRRAVRADDRLSLRGRGLAAARRAAGRGQEGAAGRPPS